MVSSNQSISYRLMVGEESGIGQIPVKAAVLASSQARVRVH